MISFCQPRASVGLSVFVASLLAAHAGLCQDSAAGQAVPAATDAAAGEAAADPALAAAIELGHVSRPGDDRPDQVVWSRGHLLVSGEGDACGPLASVAGAAALEVLALPELGVLSNEQIAAIATFIGNSWGNENGLVVPEDVQAVR